MKLQVLLDEITQAVESDDSIANTHVVLAQKISNLADMVGWADGPIDPERRLADRFGSFMESLARASETSIVALHDALAQLHEAIERHDRDLVVRRETDEEYEE